MQTIYKTMLTETTHTLLLPRGAKLLSVHVQLGTPCIWALVDSSNEVVPLPIYVVGTGHVMPDDIGEFIGTFMIDNDTLVWHVFTRRARR